MTSNPFPGHPSDRARFGPFEVDLHTHELWKFGTRLKLIGQPFEILTVLLSRPGELVTREELRDRLWPSDTFVDFNHGLNAAVNKLRDALSDSADEPRYIETLPRRGYRFIASVEWLPATDSSTVKLPVPAAQPPAPVPVQAPQPVLPAAVLPHRSSLPRYVMGAAVLFALFLGGAFILRTVSTNGAGASTRASVEQTRPLISISNTSTPAFSPDGNSVAFFRQGSKSEESGIYVSAVGSDQLVQLTNDDHDCCPVWSPDGHSLAFTRSANQNYSIYVMPSDGEEKRKAEKSVTTQSASFTLVPNSPAERKIDTGGATPTRGEIAWAPDGKSIAFAGASGIYSVTLENCSVRRLTTPTPAAQDWGPTFSPDGQRLMFVRTIQIGTPDEIWSVPAAGGEGVRILSERGRIASPPQWSYDGHSIIFSSNRTGHPALWRVSLDAPDAAVQISAAGSPAWDPTVSRRGYRLAYERLLRSLSIWQMDLFRR